MKPRSPDNNARRFARLAAIQALYQAALIRQSAGDTSEDSIFDRLPLLPAGTANAEDSPETDRELLNDIVMGVEQNGAEIDGMVDGACDAKISSGRIEILLRSILRAGAYELHRHGTIPAGVIINDYVDIAHTFFNDKEPALVNGVLDRLAKNLRSVIAGS